MLKEIIIGICCIITAWFVFKFIKLEFEICKIEKEIKEEERMLEAL